MADEKRVLNRAKDELDWYCEHKEEIDRLVDSMKQAGASGPFFVHRDGERITVTDGELGEPDVEYPGEAAIRQALKYGSS